MSGDFSDACPTTVDAFELAHCVVHGHEKRSGDKCGTVGCTLVAHLSPRRQAAFARWRCLSCGRFVRQWGPQHCYDCLAEEDRKAANLG